MMEPMKYELEELLYQMGIYLVQAGYAVVVEAAALAVEEPERLQSLTQEFYPEVGRRCRCTWNCAERSLRTATAQAWECNGALISEPGNDDFAHHHWSGGDLHSGGAGELL